MTIQLRGGRVQRVLIICPPHLVPKWKREVEQTVPGVRAAIVESITDLERLRLSIGSVSTTNNTERYAETPKLY